MWRFGIASVAVVAVLGLVAGCQPATSVTVPPASPSASVPESASPEPSFRCTPEAGGEEYDCSQAQHEEMVAKDALYAEAEEVYRRFHAEDVRMLRAGGSDQPTAVIEETTMGYFKSESLEFYRNMYKLDRRSVGGSIELVWVRRVPGVSKAGSVAVMLACTDASTTSTVQAEEEIGPGGIVQDQLYFGRDDGVLKIMGTDAKLVKEC